MKDKNLEIILILIEKTQGNSIYWKHDFHRDYFRVFLTNFNDEVGNLYTCKLYDALDKKLMLSISRAGYTYYIKNEYQDILNDLLGVIEYQFDNELQKKKEGLINDFLAMKNPM